MLLENVVGNNDGDVDTLWIASKLVEALRLKTSQGINEKRVNYFHTIVEQTFFEDVVSPVVPFEYFLWTFVWSLQWSAASIVPDEYILDYSGTMV